MSKTESKHYINGLITEGELCYTYLFGCSFIEKSFQRPVSISDNLVLIPAGTKTGTETGRQGRPINIELAHGASFGTGSHPTTRLALLSIEKILIAGELTQFKHRTNALDIGTGSGVLVIASVLMGINQAIGTDIDAVARKEANENVERNNLSNRIDISDKELDEIDGTFSLITANLRFPTLMAIHPHIKRLTAPKSGVVFSGIRPDEVLPVCSAYEECGFKQMWQQEEAGWASVVFIRR